MRACELHAIRIQDKVFLGSGHVDEAYRMRRDSVFIIGVNCGTAGGTCFCVSMKTGPELPVGYDIGLTEVADGFLVDVGSDRGQALVDKLPSTTAAAADHAEKTRLLEHTRQSMGRTMPEVRKFKPDHPRWEEVTRRCLACTNCTMVCPTCFCTSVHDVSDLEGQGTESVREWDSCFNLDFTYVHGGSVRSSRHDLGYEVMKRFLYVVQERLDRLLLQLLDVYGVSA